MQIAQKYFLQIFLFVLNCNNQVFHENSNENNSHPKKTTQEIESSNIQSSESVTKNKKEIETIEILTQKNSNKKREIEFEDIIHYPFTVTEKKFWLINNQQEMNNLFREVHRFIKGNRLPPIPTVESDESYIIIKPTLTTTNDIVIKQINVIDHVLYIIKEDFNNPQMDSNSRVPPNIFLKLNETITISDVIIQ